MMGEAVMVVVEGAVAVVAGGWGGEGVGGGSHIGAVGGGR